MQLRLREERMPTLTIDDEEIEVEAGPTSSSGLELAGKEIPRFCYHERLGSRELRMCLVEMNERRNPSPPALCPLARE